MDFEIDIQSAKRLPRVFDRLSEDAGKGKTYVQTNTTLEYGEGLLNDISGAHENAVKQLGKFLDDIARYTATQTGTAVDEAIRYYESTDTAAAAELDKTYRAGDVDRSQFVSYYRTSGDTTAFTDRVEPQDNYRPIADYNQDAAFQFAPQLWDVASPTSAARDAVWGGTWLAAKMGVCDRAYDPYEAWVKPISGDWAGVRGCADVFSNVSFALEDMSANLRFAALGLDGIWTGQAASAFQAHVISSAKRVAAASGPLVALSEQYKTTSTAMFEIGKVLGSLVSDIVDAALIFIAEASLAAASSETVVGGVVFGAAALYEGYKLWDLIKEALDLIGRADSLTSALNATAGDFGLVDEIGTFPVLPPPPNLPSSANIAGR